jgi:hypothetical protein
LELAKPGFFSIKFQLSTSASYTFLGAVAGGVGGGSLPFFHAKFRQIGF